MSFFRLLAISRTTRGKRPNTFLIGCIRVFITAVCKSPVTTRRLLTALAISSFSNADSSVLIRFLTSTSSPTIFMISSRRLVSTRTLVSAACLAGAAFASTFSAAGAFSTGFGVEAFVSAALSDAGGLAGLGTDGVGAGGSACAFFAPCNSSRRASNSSSVMSSLPVEVGAGVGAGGGVLGFSASLMPGAELPWSWSNKASNSSSVISSSAAVLADSDP